MNHDTDCPSCGRPMRLVAADGGPGSPKAGDFTLCIGCLRLAIFTHDLALRPLTPEESAIFRRHPKFAGAAQRASDWRRKLDLE